MEEKSYMNMKNKMKLWWNSWLKFKYQFWVLLFVLPMITFSLAFFITSAAIKPGQMTDALPESTPQENENAGENQSGNLEEYVFEIPEKKLFFLQISSMRNADAARAATDFFANEGISAVAYEESTQFRMVNAIAHDRSSLELYRSSFVEKFPQYNDAFIVEKQISFISENYLSYDGDLYIGKNLSEYMEFTSDKLYSKNNDLTLLDLGVEEQLNMLRHMSIQLSKVDANEDMVLIQVLNESILLYEKGIETQEDVAFFRKIYLDFVLQLMEN